MPHSALPQHTGMPYGIDQNILPRMGAAILERAPRRVRNLRSWYGYRRSPKHWNVLSAATPLKYIRCTAVISLVLRLRSLARDADSSYIKGCGISDESSLHGRACSQCTSFTVSKAITLGRLLRSSPPPGLAEREFNGKKEWHCASLRVAYSAL